MCSRRAWQLYLRIIALQQMVSKVINLSDSEGGENKREHNDNEREEEVGKRKRREKE